MRYGRLRFYGSNDSTMLPDGSTIDFMVHEVTIDGIKILFAGNGKQNRVMDIDRPDDEWIAGFSFIYGTNYEWIYPLSENRITIETPDPVK